CAFMQQEKFSEALKQFQAIETSHAHHFETQANIATCYFNMHDLEKAKEHYLKASELAPKDTQMLFNLGVIFTQLGNIDFAIQYYQRAIKINPDFFAAQNNLGVAFLVKQHVAFALQHFKEALRIHPENKALQHTVQFLSKDSRLTTSPPEYL